MWILSLFKKKTVITELITNNDFDKFFNVVFINGFDDKYAEVYLKTDKSYESVFKMFNIKKSAAVILPFSKGVEEFCIKRDIPVIMKSKVNPELIKYFLPYLRFKGVSDKLVHAFESCWNI